MNDWNIYDSKEKMELAKQWMQRLIDGLKDGAIWGIPRSNAMYKFDKKKKIATALGPGRDEAVEVVLKKIGWSILSGGFG
jgi:hypothetical protein